MFWYHVCKLILIMVAGLIWFLYQIVYWSLMLCILIVVSIISLIRSNNERHV